MSGSFEFSFAGPNDMMNIAKVLDLGNHLDSLVANTYGDEMIASGVIAFAADKSLVAIAIMSYGLVSDEELAGVADSPGSWDEFVAWMGDLGVTDFMSFVRRPPTYGHDLELREWDDEMMHFLRVQALGATKRLTYQGHVIVNGARSVVYVGRPEADAMMDLFVMAGVLPGYDKDGRPALVHLPESRDSIVEARAAEPESRPDIPRAFYN